MSRAFVRKKKKKIKEGWNTRGSRKQENEKREDIGFDERVFVHSFFSFLSSLG